MANSDYDYAEYYRTELIPHRKPILDKMEREMDRDGNIPMIVWPEVGRNLYVLAKAVRAKRILELGTGIGYATIWLAEAARFCGGKVLTVERDKALAEEAKQNFRDAHVSLNCKQSQKEHNLEKIRKIWRPTFFSCCGQKKSYRQETLRKRRISPQRGRRD